MKASRTAPAVAVRLTPRRSEVNSVVRDFVIASSTAMTVAPTAQDNWMPVELRKEMPAAVQPTEVRVAILSFLESFQTRSWDAFESCFSESATIFLSAESSEALPWSDLREGWRQVFTAESD